MIEQNIQNENNLHKLAFLMKSFEGKQLILDDKVHILFCSEDILDFYDCGENEVI